MFKAMRRKSWVWNEKHIAGLIFQNFLFKNCYLFKKIKKKGFILHLLTSIHLNAILHSYFSICTFSFLFFLNIHSLPWSLFHSDLNNYHVQGTQHLSLESAGMCKMYLLYCDSSSCMNPSFPSADFPYSYGVGFAPCLNLSIHSCSGRFWLPAKSRFKIFLKNRLTCYAGTVYRLSSANLCSRRA